jgi:CHASE3 domain sensor protein
MALATNRFFIKHATGIIVFAITVMIVLAAALFYQQQLATERDKSLVVHTYEVTGHIQLFYNRLKDVELGQRGYRLTSDEKYLGTP